MEVFIRTATLNDAPSISNLSDQLGYQSGISETEKRLQAVLQDGNNCVFVAVVDEKIIGWIHGFYTVRVESDPFTEIGGLVVDENYRRQNIGKLLINKIVEWALARENKTVRVRCNTIRKGSHQFYLALGFAEVKEQKVFQIQLN